METQWIWLALVLVCFAIVLTSFAVWDRPTSLVTVPTAPVSSRMQVP